MMHSKSFINVFIISSLSFFMSLLISPSLSYSSENIVIKSGTLNIRNHPLLGPGDSKIIGTAKKGEQYPLITEELYLVCDNPEKDLKYKGGTWYKIRLDRGHYGWVAGTLKYDKKIKKNTPYSSYIEQETTFSTKVTAPIINTIPKDTKTSRKGTREYTILGAIIVVILFLLIIGFTSRYLSLDTTLTAPSYYYSDYSSNISTENHSQQVYPLFETQKIEQSIVSDDKKLKNHSREKDNQIIKNADGKKIGEMWSNIWGERIIVAKKTKKIVEIMKNILRKTEIK